MSLSLHWRNKLLNQGSNMSSTYEHDDQNEFNLWIRNSDEIDFGVNGQYELDFWIRDLR